MTTQLKIWAVTVLAVASTAVWAQSAALDSLNSDEAQELIDAESTGVAPQAYEMGSRDVKKTLPGAPAMIPHSIKNITITREKNMCLMCHAYEPGIGAAKVKNVPQAMPMTHWKKDDQGHLTPSAARFECTLCHAPQASVSK